MKTALVVMDKVEQIAFTPETDLERSFLNKIAKVLDDKGVKHFRGSVGHCVGGWTRLFSNEHESEGLIFVFDEVKS